MLLGYELLFQITPPWWVSVVTITISIFACYRWFISKSVIIRLTQYVSVPVLSLWPRVIIVLKLLCILTGAWLLWITYAMPYIHTDTQQDNTMASRVYIAIDISRSMAAVDVQPNRLELVKHKIKELMIQCPTAHIGIIIFAGSAYVYCPITSDHAVVQQMLDGIDTQTLTNSSTALETPIQVALDSFERLSAAHKALILFTDGEDFGTGLQETIERAKQQHLALCVVGVGTPQGSPIPLFDEQSTMIGHIKDKQGNVVISRINQQKLEDLARTLNGIYAIADVHTNKDIQQCISFINTQCKTGIEQVTPHTRMQLYPVTAALALIFLLIEWLV